jgi:hypothetical protein
MHLSHPGLKTGAQSAQRRPLLVLAGAVLSAVVLLHAA